MKAPKGLRLLGGYLNDYRRSIALALGLGLITYGCAALLMFTSGYLIAKTANPATTLFMVMTPVAFVQLFGLGRPAARYFERLVSHDWVLRITSKLRMALFQAAQRQARRPGESRALGEYLAVLTGDIAHLQNLFLRVVFPVLIALLLFAGACILCGVFSVWLLGLMVLCGLACVFLLPYLAMLLTRGPIAAAQGLQSRHTVRLTDDILGAADWIISGRGREACEANARAGNAIARCYGRVRRTVGAIELVSVLAMGAAIPALLAITSSLFGGNPEESNYIAAFVLGFFPLIEVFMLLPSALSDSAVHRGALQNLADFLDSDEPAGNHKAAAADTPDVPVPMPRPRSLAVAVDGVTFSYDGKNGGQAVLRDLNLKVPAGCSLALLGRSGSGKSTLGALLRGYLAPLSGTITYDTMELPDLPWPLHEAVGYIAQEPHLFNRTLRDNLNLTGRAISDETLRGILESVGLGAKLRKLPKGLDTVIGETGVGFSGGEAHRVALARILAADTPVVILDEPFSALDPATEQALLDTLFSVMKGRTLIVITHHLAQIDRFDQVAFIEDGRIALTGTPKELQRDSAYFRTLRQVDRSFL